MYNMYGAHICKYIVKWRNYIKRDLNLKWPNWGSFDILKLIFLCTHLEKASRAYFDWYLEASKRGNGRVTSLQKINKKLFETISKLKRLLALTLPGHRSSGTEKSGLAFKPFGFRLLGINLPSFWGTLATWLLISRHLLAFCFIWSVTPGWWSSGSVWFVCTDIWFKLLELMCELLTLRFHTPPGNTLGKCFKWLVSLQLWSNDKKSGLKMLDLYWHRIGKWTEVPLCPGLPPVINSQGLIKLRPPLPQRDNPWWDQSPIVIRANLNPVWSKFWL